MSYFKFSETDSPGFLLWQVSALWRRKINEVLSGFALTHTQYVILAVTLFLSQNETPPTQKSISDVSMIDAMTLSQAARLLEKKGLLARARGKEDTRAKNIALTTAGDKLLQKLIPLVEDVDRQFFEVGKKEQRLTIRALSALIDRNR